MIRRLVACPRRSPHAEQVAQAFGEDGSLAGYVTGFVTPRWATPSRLARLPAWVAASLSARRLDALAERRVISLPWVDATRALLSRAGLPGGADLAWEADDHLFGRIVGRPTWLEQADSVHGFEHSSLELFEAARRLGRRTVLHVPSPHPSFMAQVIDEALARDSNLGGGGELGLYPARHARRVERRLRELELADLIVANSALSAGTFVTAGADPGRVLSVPLGGAPVDPTCARLAAADGPLRVLFAGVLGIHKGVHVLLRAWASARCREATLTIVGGLAIPPRLLDVPRATWLGPLPHSEALRLMADADLLVVPSLADGFGLVVPEALGRGTPVLASDHVGAAALIQEGRNGWVLPAGDVDALADRLRWFERHASEVRAMRPACPPSVADYTWDAYRARLRRAVDEAGV